MVAGKISATDMLSYNDDAFKQFNEKSLYPCQNCGRTFLPDSLKIHLKSCGGPSAIGGKTHKTTGISKPTATHSQVTSSSSSVPALNRPKALTCYIWYPYIY
jgi:hypothetical protein